MKPSITLLDAASRSQIVREAFELLRGAGIRVGTSRVGNFLTDGGVVVANETAHISARIVERALATVPSEFYLYDRSGNRAVHYGGDEVHFDPGSSCVNILDAETRQPRAATTEDLARLVKVAEGLEQFAAQSTALVCNDIPAEIGDLYRLLLVLWYSSKPVVTGAFSAKGLQGMVDLLIADAGSQQALQARPRAVFDVCPSSPLDWSQFGADNLIDLACLRVPAEVVPAPMAGATSPVTLWGTVVQHTAEVLGGIVIHQLAQPGAPVVWGGAPAIFDMRTGATPWGAVETAMMNVACAQIGKQLGVPTHAYLCASDSKLLDAQAGLESGMSALIGSLAGINMISGAGMLEFLSCQSIEKLVMDAEAIDMSRRFLRGIANQREGFAKTMILDAGQRGGFLKLEATRQMFRGEQHLPSPVIDRDPMRTADVADAFGRARVRVQELVATYKRPTVAPEVERAWLTIVWREARGTPLREFPGIEAAMALRS